MKRCQEPRKRALATGGGRGEEAKHSPGATTRPGGPPDWHTRTLACSELVRPQGISDTPPPSVGVARAGSPPKLCHSEPHQQLGSWRALTLERTNCT